MRASGQGQQERDDPPATQNGASKKYSQVSFAHMTDQRAQPDFEGYKRCIADLTTREISNSETYDRALFTLSTALLGFSLVFIKEVMGPTPSHLWMLYTAWSFLAGTVVVAILSFLYSQRAIRKLKPAAHEFFIEGKDEMNKLSERYGTRTRLFNVGAGFCFVAGIVFLMIFVMLNIR